MRCPQCTATLEDGASHCHECGFMLGTGGTDDDGQDDGPAADSEGSERGDHDSADSVDSEQSAQGQHGGTRQGQPSTQQGRPGATQSGQPRTQSGQSRNQSGQPSQQHGRQGANRQGQHSQQQGRQSGTQQRQPAGHQQSRRSRTGGDPQTRAKRVLVSLPWKSGALAGAFTYGVFFLIFWAVVDQLGGSGALEAATLLFTGLVSFEPPSSMLASLLIPDVPSELVTGQYDALVGAAYLLVPWILYAVGRGFARKQPGTNPVDYVAGGVTVVAGTAPVTLLVSGAFGGDIVYDLAVAGILVPGVLGALGGLGVWVFREYDRAGSWGGGFVAGLLGFVLCVGATFVWAQGSVGVGDQILARLTAALAAFVGVTIGGFAGGSVGFLGYAAVLVPVAGIGYLRARGSRATPMNALTGARAGAALVAGFSVVLCLALTAYTVVFIFGASIVQGNPLVYLPSAMPASGFPQLNTLYNYLQGFVVGGIVFPILVGAVGGALGGSLEGRSRRGGQQAPQQRARQQRR